MSVEIPDKDVVDIPDQRSKKDPLKMTANENFELFIKEGNVFGTRKKSRGLKKFIPNSPDAGLDQAFGSDAFSINSRKSGNKVLKRLFDF